MNASTPGRVLGEHSENEFVREVYDSSDQKLCDASNDCQRRKISARKTICDQMRCTRSATGTRLNNYLDTGGYIPSSIPCTKSASRDRSGASGLGRIAFVHKKYADAERWHGDVVARFGTHFCSGSNVSAGCVALQGDERSHGTEQSCRGASNHLPIQCVGEQLDSMAAFRNETESSSKSDWLRIKSVKVCLL
jgi:hypothetical protein